MDYSNRHLIDYYPPIIQKIEDFKALCAALDTELYPIGGLFDKIFKLIDESYISSATEYGVKRWEKMLNILPYATQSIEDRKAVIFSRIAEQPPYSWTILKMILDVLCGVDNYSLIRNIAERSVTFKLFNGSTDLNRIVAVRLRQIIPANMVLYISTTDNQHATLRPFTHEDLQVYTLTQLRTEDLDA